mmetsp:Transcript_32862/g.69138  ORF Transcript_32862/g.69138 Transcript_32862/m.69138 type:complete len:89 (+) Transcript_32862:487-753(+)
MVLNRWEALVVVGFTFRRILICCLILRFWARKDRTYDDRNLDQHESTMENMSHFRVCSTHAIEFLKWDYSSLSRHGHIVQRRRIERPQ